MASKSKSVSAAERRELEGRLRDGRGIPAGFSFTPHGRDVFARNDPPEDDEPAPNGVDPDAPVDGSGEDNAAS